MAVRRRAILQEPPYVITSLRVCSRSGRNATRDTHGSLALSRKISSMERGAFTMTDSGTCELPVRNIIPLDVEIFGHRSGAIPSFRCTRAY